jgi:hypothetical protein
MQCLHCGKKLSFLRKLADGRFCSDEHREEYERLQNDLALARLMGARGKPKAGARGGIALPLAPLLPEALRIANCRRLAQPPLQLIAFEVARFLPEPDLRPGVRGFPGASPCPLAAPAKNGGSPLWVPRTEALFSPGNGDAAIAVAPVLPLDEMPGGGVFCGAAGVSDDEPARPAAPAEPPSPPMAAALVPELAPVAGALRPWCPKSALSRLSRKKLVVIVPKSGLKLHPAKAKPGRLLGEGVEPAPVAWKQRAQMRPGGPIFPAAPTGFLPARAQELQPPEPALPSAMALEEPAPEEHPPLCGRQEPVALSAALPAAVHLEPSSAEAEFALPPALVPAPAHSVLPGRLREAAMISVEQRAWRPEGPARQYGWSPPPDLCPPGPVLPGRPVAAARPPAAWPCKPGLVPFALAPVCAARIVPGPVGGILPAEGLVVCIPGLNGEFPARQLRPAWKLAGLSLPAVPPETWRLEPAPVATAWPDALPALPASGLDPVPPEAPAPAEAAAGTAAVEESLAALDACQRVAPPIAELEAAPQEDGSPAAEANAGLQPPLAEPAPEAGPADFGGDAGQERQPHRVAGRVPEMPIRPVDCVAALAGAESGIEARPCWTSLDEPRPMTPTVRFELDHADGSGPRRRGQAGRQAKWSKPHKAAAPARRFWSHAPSDLKWIALVLPLLLVLAVYSFRSRTPNPVTGEHEMASAATGSARSAAPENRLNALQRIILRRAAIRLFDDFRGGLGSWEGRDGWAKTWRYGEATFLEPGELALLTPSLGMTDYTLTFLGQIERRSLNWVFRARDLSNYYSMRIVITRGGPLPEAVVVRSVVINGKEQESRTLPIPFPVRADTLYLVRMEVRGQDFTTYIQNQLVDHFSDSRLRQGGIGFYSPKGDRALLRWVEVSHQYDYLGRLCALLSPYGVQTLAGN